MPALPPGPPIVSAPPYLHPLWVPSLAHKLILTRHSVFCFLGCTLLPANSPEEKFYPHLASTYTHVPVLSFSRHHSMSDIVPPSTPASPQPSTPACPPSHHPKIPRVLLLRTLVTPPLFHHATFVSSPPRSPPLHASPANPLSTRSAILSLRLRSQSLTRLFAPPLSRYLASSPSSPYYFRDPYPASPFVQHQSSVSSHLASILRVTLARN